MCDRLNVEHPIPFLLQELSDELSCAILSEIDGRIDGVGALRKSPL